MSEVYSNGAAPLSAAITAASTSLVLSSALVDKAGAPLSGTCRLAIESEVVAAVTTDGLNYALTRGTEGTAAAAHAAGVTASAVLTSAGLGAILAAVVPPAAPSGEVILLNANANGIAADATWTDSGLSIAIPAAGTYLVGGTLRSGFGTNSTGQAFLEARFFDSAAGAALANSELMLLLVAAPTSGVVYQAANSFCRLLTFAAATTLKVQIQRNAGPSWQPASPGILSADTAGRTSINYLKVG